MYRYADGILKNYLSLKQEAHHFTAHAWLSDEKLIVGNNRAELFLVQNCEILMEIKIYDIRENHGRQSISSSAPPGGETRIASVDTHEVTSIIPYSKGFIVSCGKGKAFLYDKVDEKEAFRKQREVRIPPDQYSNDPSKSEDQVITSMCISPNEETFLAVTNWQQIYKLTFSSVDVGKVRFLSNTVSRIHNHFDTNIL